MGGISCGGSGRWRHPTISSSVAPFSSCLQSALCSHISPPLEPPSHPTHNPTSLGQNRAPSCAPCAMQQLPTLSFSRSVMFDSLWSHRLQPTRLPCPSTPPRVCSKSCPLSHGCHPTISSSVIPFSSCLQSFPASGSFQMSWLFASGDQSIGASASASVLPVKYSGLISFRIDWSDLLAVQGTLKSLLQHYSSKASILLHSAFFTVQLSHLYMTTGKNIALTIRTFVCKAL